LTITFGRTGHGNPSRCSHANVRSPRAVFRNSILILTDDWKVAERSKAVRGVNDTSDMRLYGECPVLNGRTSATRNSN